jgi:putative transposase
MNEQTYPSDLTDEAWEWIQELIPAAKSGGRPRTLCMRAVLNAIFYGDYSILTGFWYGSREAFVV